MRNEPCLDENCKTCFHARTRGLNQQKALYTGDNGHYALTSPGNWELYDIESDPYQKINIAESYPEMVKQMTTLYEKWWAKVEPVMKARWSEKGELP